MSSQIHWQVFLRAKSREKADKLLTRFVQEVGLEATVTSCERYWKDSSLFQANLVSLLPAAEPAVAGWKTLELCSKLARSWTVTSPQYYQGGYWEFSGSAHADAITLVGAAFIDFRVGNLHLRESDSVTPEQAAIAST